MFTVKIFTELNNKILYIKDINNSIILNKEIDLEEGEYSLKRDELLNIIKKQSEEYDKYEKIILKSKEITNEDINNISKEYFVYILCMHPSRTCNLACKYCFAQDGEEYLPKKGIDIETAKKAVDFLVSDYGKNAVKYQIDIAGSGEPLLKYDFIKELDEYCALKSSEIGKEIKIMFPTNATLLNDEMLEYLNKSSTILLGISLDGNKEHSSNRLLKNGENAYDSIAKGAKLINRPFGIAVTITHNNEEVDEVFDYLYNEFPLADSISMQFVRNYDLSSDISFYKIDIDNLFNHYKKLVDNIFKHIDKKDYDYVLTLLRGSDTFGKYIFKALNKGKLHVERCGAGKGTICVDDNGDIYSCSVANGDEYFKIGNIQEGIDKEKQEKFKKVNVNCNDHCKNCWGAYICGGECLVKARLSSGSIYEPNLRICELKLKLIQLSIAFTEKLKKDYYEAYKYLKNFRVDNTLLDTSLWAINYYLKSKDIHVPYKILMEKVQRGKYGVDPNDLFGVLKKYDEKINVVKVDDFSKYKDMNYPAIAYINRFKYYYGYLIVEGFDGEKLKIRDMRKEESMWLPLEDFHKDVSSILMATLKK